MIAATRCCLYSTSGYVYVEDTSGLRCSSCCMYRVRESGELPKPSQRQNGENPCSSPLSLGHFPVHAHRDVQRRVKYDMTTWASKAVRSAELNPVER
jgi:hypothetical protein